MERAVPIQTLHLFPVLHELLVDMLRSLEPADRQKSTIAPLWTVKDIVAHLLDVNMRTIASTHNYSGNCFHIAREYTEKWHHQQQITALQSGQITGDETLAKVMLGTIAVMA